MAGGRHPAEVAKFMTLYAELRQRTDDDSSDLVGKAKRDASIQPTAT